MALEITNNNFDEVVLKADIAIVDFSAQWCGPCRQLEPIINELSNDNPDITIGKVNIDENPELAVKFGVRSIPTTIVFADGEISEKIMGFKTKNIFQEKIEALKS
jgi:thioredoxin 1